MMAVQQDRLNLSDVPRFIDQYPTWLRIDCNESGQIVKAEIKLALCHFLFRHNGDDMEFRISQPCYEIVYQVWRGSPAQILQKNKDDRYYCHLSASEIEYLKVQFQAITFKLYEKASH